MRRLIVLIFVTLLAAACAGGSSPTLHLATGDFTEDELRTQIRQNAVAQGLLMRGLCENLSDRSGEDAVERFVEANYMANRTPVATPEEQDRDRAAEILREECNELLQ